MSSYICAKCGCVDNTACGGNYWSYRSKHNYFNDEFANNNPLCVECTPTEYSDGSKNREAGKWHNRFPKKHWSEYRSREETIEECKRGQGNVVNAIDYFEKLDSGIYKEVYWYKEREGQVLQDNT